ncbi:actin-like ATPase domain-containing protein [Coemansia reversa NRRL 1564]|uniref:Actin-like ATPase domain-containing protein n=1 Tax=Coemansia reversa (strain ATCC 12441 / NRRL 1564) TaxID=763665 RepID=A0A2G5B9Z5_COERN|nr:actin-like ATPase domain-containing protein [Coemansia reversa NRRL 1564]|eukprot:PIA15835.1 actin-like ATPase domain-containing protein [Coemansia reversa NRRL 1564]
MAPRRPEQTFAGVRNLLGVAFDSEEAAAYREQFPNRMVRDAETGAVAFESGTEGAAPLTVPEIVAMQLRYARQLVVESEGVEVHDVVLTVPPFFDRQQRQAMLDAAALAGLRTVALVNDGSAVALSYAMSRSFERAERHVIYDMGAGKTAVTVVGMFERKSGAKGQRAPVVSVQAYAADRMLGGQTLDFLVRDLLVARFAGGSKALENAVRGSARAMSRLLREAKRVKTILSANTEATAAVEGLHDGVDLRTRVTRAELEDTASHLVPRIGAPLERALAAANVTLDDVATIVLVGGGTRVPLVQQTLAREFGEERLSRSVNAEEACVLGATFRGAALSSLFRVRDVRLRDAAPYAVRATYTTDAEPGSTQAEETLALLPAFGAVGARRVIRSVRATDMTIAFEARASDGADEWTPLASARVSGVTAAAAKLKSRQVLSETPEVRVVVQITELGAFEVVKAEALFNVTNPAHSTYVADLAAWEIESASASADTSNLRTRPTPPPETTTEAVLLDVDVDYERIARLSDDALRRSRKLLRRMDDDDTARAARHAAINQLESLIYHLRDAVEEDDVVLVTTAAQRVALDNALTTAAQWLEDHGESAAVDAAEEQIAVLKDLEAPIVYRKAQLAERPSHIATLQAAIVQAENFTALVRSQHASPDTDDFIALPLETLEDVVDSTVTWLGSMVAQQDALTPSDDPVLTLAEIDAKALAITQGLARLIAANTQKTSSTDSSKADPDNSVDEEDVPKQDNEEPVAEDRYEAPSGDVRETSAQPAEHDEL